MAYKVAGISSGLGDPWVELYCHRNPMQYFAGIRLRLTKILLLMQADGAR